MVDWIFGIAYLGGLGFAVYCWFSALTAPSEAWTGKLGKTPFLIIWVVTGAATLGFGPMGLSIWYYLKVRPSLHRAKPSPTGAPAAWYSDPKGEKRLRFWDGSQWTNHLAE